MDDFILSSHYGSSIQQDVIVGTILDETDFGQFSSEETLTSDVHFSR
jgi:hypothetical protein